MIEDLGVVGTLSQSVKPHADRLIAVSFPDVEVGQSVSQSAGLRTTLQQRLAQSNTLIIPTGTTTSSYVVHAGQQAENLNLQTRYYLLKNY